MLIRVLVIITSGIAGLITQRILKHNTKSVLPTHIHSVVWKRDVFD